MTVRTATCACGQFRAECRGEPFRVSVCHCLDCKRRSGSAFAAQARWADEDVTLTGEYTVWERTADSGSKGRFFFCPDCGSTLAYQMQAMPGSTAVAMGAFADPGFPPPQFSVYESRKHAWLDIIGDVEHD